MDDSKVRDIVRQAIVDSNASGMKDMGKVMGIVMREVNGQADGNTVMNILENYFHNEGSTDRNIQ